MTATLNVFTSTLKGLAPSSGGGTTNFLRADATWAAPPGGGGAALTISPTPPASPTVGQLWWDSTGGQLYLWYDDGTSQQWIVAVNQSLAVAGGVPVGTSILWNRTVPPANYLIEDGSTISATTYAALFQVLVQSATVTITIASPGVVTWTGHVLQNGDPVKFTTTGALPTGITAGTTYYVINRATNTFQIATAPGGTAINTSGTQSGVHTGISAPFGCANDLSTFNLPDSRGEFVRGWDAGRAVDINRGFGVAQTDAFQGHFHGGGYGAGGIVPVSGGSQQASNTTGPITDGVNGTPRTAAETRPRNVTKVYCIKYQ
jgi:phage-related tail fiber protein